jgi:hypothetical protein
MRPFRAAVIAAGRQVVSEPFLFSGAFMTKPLTVRFRDKSINLTLVEKVERSRLYGYVETEVIDAAGRRCELATLTGDGHSLVGKGGTALAYLSPHGLWRKKTELKPVDLHGQVITPVNPTFAAPVTLEKTVSIDDYLSHNIDLVYRLMADEEHAPLKRALQVGAIFQFPFSYRGGLAAAAGFLLLGSDGHLFLCVGAPTSIDFVGLQAASGVVTDTQTVADDEDMLDFSLD